MFFYEVGGYQTRAKRKDPGKTDDADDDVALCDWMSD